MRKKKNSLTAKYFNVFHRFELGKFLADRSKCLRLIGQWSERDSIRCSGKIIFQNESLDRIIVDNLGDRKIVHLSRHEFRFMRGF